VHAQCDRLIEINRDAILSPSFGVSSVRHGTSSQH